MRFHADLHVHSKYSRATSRDLDLEHLAHWAARKGVGVVGTGDFVHPAWLAELKQKLVPAEGASHRANVTFRNLGGRASKATGRPPSVGLPISPTAETAKVYATAIVVLGAQVNVDMPWNPSRLEQRKGRVQRIGQMRDNVHVLNLRYADTVEDDVYTALSNRFGDIFLVLGQLPDAFEDDWIAAILQDRSAVRNFSQRSQL